MTPALRPAVPDDAAALAAIIRQTSGGLVDYLLDSPKAPAAPEELLAVAVAESGHALSHENALVLESDERIVGLLLAYAWREHAAPDLLTAVAPLRRILAMSPLLRKADRDSLYINTLWLDPALRGQGAAEALVDCAGLLAKEHGLPKLSLNVWADNGPALKLYSRLGFVVYDRFTPPSHPLIDHPGGNLFMRRELVPNGPPA